MIEKYPDYSNNGGLSWVQFSILNADSGVTPQASSLDVGDLLPGEYLVRIHASADDAPDAGVLFSPIRVGEHHTVYIRLA